MKSPKVIVAFDRVRARWIASIQMPEGHTVGSWAGGNEEEARKKAKAEFRQVVANERRKAKPETLAICVKVGFLKRFLNCFSR